MKFSLFVTLLITMSCDFQKIGADSSFVVNSILSPPVENITSSGNTLLTQTPTFSWSEPIQSDGNLRTYTYEVGVGTNPKKANVIELTSIGSVLSHRFNSTPTLSASSNYYFIVRATDNTGRPSILAASQPFFPTLVQVSGVFELPESPFYLESCQHYLESDYYKNNGSGRYQIDPDGTGGLAAFTAQCDMTEDGGGWTLMLNYVHSAGDNTALSVRNSNLPLINSSILGSDESSNLETWGHASNGLTNILNPSELRFYCITSTHSRVMDFKTSHAGSINYAKSGVGSMNGLGSSFETLSNHNARLPGTINSFFINRADEAISRFPFYDSGTSHWGVRANGNRWECDDNTIGDFQQDTIHRVWYR